MRSANSQFINSNRKCFVRVCIFVLCCSFTYDSLHQLTVGYKRGHKNKSGKCGRESRN